MADISDFARPVGLDGRFSDLTTLRHDRTMQASVVNAGVVPHPVGGTAVVGFVMGGGTRKRVSVRAYRQATVVIRAGSEWVVAQGPIELIGPEGPLTGIEAEARMAAKGSAECRGDLGTGNGNFTAADTITGRYTCSARVEEDGGPTPSSSSQRTTPPGSRWPLSSIRAQAGTPPDSIHTDARVTPRLVDGTPTITKIALVTVGRVGGIDDATFAEQAEAAKAGCPGSRAPVGVPEITLEASPAT
jgi:osmotically inducible protein OsmC